MALVSVLSGVVADKAISKGVPVISVRRWAQTIAFCIPAFVCYLLSNPNISPGFAMVCFTLILGAKSIGQVMPTLIPV